MHKINRKLRDITRLTGLATTTPPPSPSPPASPLLAGLGHLGLAGSRRRRAC